ARARIATILKVEGTNLTRSLKVPGADLGHNCMPKAVSRHHRRCILPRVGFVLHSSEGARYVRGTELRLRDTLHATLKIIIRHPSSSEAPRQDRGTELMLRDNLRAT
ncbi:hypothetical protein HAX54_017114, partial [Datura stramonium]|nr:hypothetical protein [Datura stramonium]